MSGIGCFTLLLFLNAVVWNRGWTSNPMSFPQASQDYTPMWCTSKCGSWFLAQLPAPALPEQVHKGSPAALLHCSLAAAIAHCGTRLGTVWVLQAGVQRSLGSAQSSCSSFKCCCCGHWSGRVSPAPGYRERATVSDGCYSPVLKGLTPQAAQTQWIQVYLTSGLLLWHLLQLPIISPTLTNLVSSLHVFLPPRQFLAVILILPFKDNFQEIIFKHSHCLLLNCTRQEGWS